MTSPAITVKITATVQEVREVYCVGNDMATE